MTPPGGVVTLGESLAVLRAAGPLDDSDDLRVGTGGAEGNVAVGLARSGVPVSWLGRVGADPFGRRVVRDLRGAGVDVRVIEDQAPTGMILKDAPLPGRTRVRYLRSGSAGSRLAPGDLELLDIAGADLLHVTGITPALSDSAAETVLVAISNARQAGVAVSFDVNYRSALWSPERAIARLSQIVRLADVVFAGLEEARMLAGTASASDLDAAAAIQQMGPSEVVVTLGSDGAMSRIGEAIYRHPAVPVDAVDTVGAGDAFVAAYLAARLRGLTPEARLIAGTTCGALACLHHGDWEGFPRSDQLQILVDRDPVAR
jgi:2-dehydro-3-deoxygluconokinase